LLIVGARQTCTYALEPVWSRGFLSGLCAVGQAEVGSVEEAHVSILASVPLLLRLQPSTVGLAAKNMYVRRVTHTFGTPGKNILGCEI